MMHVVAAMALALGGGLWIDAPQVKVSEPKLRSIYYKTHTLRDFVDADTKFLVITFLGPKCPLVPQVLPKLKALEKDLANGKAGVRFLGIYTGTSVHVTQMSFHAQDNQVPFRVLLDSEQSLTRLYGVTRLSETLVLDVRQQPVAGRYPVIYRGQVDDQMGVGNRKPEPRHRYLEAALGEAIAGKPVSIASTEPEGCLIQFGAPKPLAGITYHAHVRPILQARCQNCHRTGDAGPMELTSYDDAFSYGGMIKEMVVDRRMPPWSGHSPLPLRDDHRLTPKEVETIASWVDTGMEEGDPKSAPPAASWPDPKAWRIGTPDVVWKTKAYKVPATGYLQYQYFLVPTGLTEDRYIQAIQIRTSAPQVVHHIQVLEGNADPSITEPRGPVVLDPAQQIKLHGFSLEDSRLLANYAPGNNDNATTYPADKAMRIRKGAILFLETHYTTNGKETLEEAEVGIVWRKGPPPKTEVRTQWFYRNRGHFKIPAGAGNVRLEKDDIFIKNQDIRILSLRMHLHARGKDFLIEKISPGPNGSDQVEKLLQIATWDFGWQRTYAFQGENGSEQSPVTLLGGESLRAIAHWDNSRWNPSNPDPGVDVFWGQQTKDEMMAVMMTYEVLTPEESRAERAKRGAR